MAHNIHFAWNIYTETKSWGRGIPRLVLNRKEKYFFLYWLFLYIFIEWGTWHEQYPQK